MTIFERGIYAPRGLAAIARRLTLLRRGDTLELMQKGRLKIPIPKLKALGTTGAKRVAALPDVPTVAESALPGYEAVNWYGVFVPAGTPRDMVTRMHADILRILKQPDAAHRWAR